MAKTLTFSQAQSRFAALATTGISIADAIREAVDRIYEKGRYPGTTEEIELSLDMFSFNSDTNEWTISFDEERYDGAIGFRTSSRGWAIVDKVSLYRDGVNSGDYEFVDLGSSEVGDVESDVFEPVRSYCCPLGFDPSQGGPYYALMKLESPELEDDTVIPIQSIGALHHAIVAVCYEYVNDIDRANMSWALFEQSIGAATRQVEGPKRYSLGMDSSLKRKPRQFN